ncbi:argininosuccinate lyase [Neobacillus niacini]|uniref:argininosuccinate lyase n=1 Tax=Neobacillus niacini TaxID=86668 RepID=UPI001C8DAFA3|nr:argininosuccinate lyase [Neobacillus niacini]MBY0146928.1 argininosuccinate lyase [Neobacillus niacini]
MNALNEDGKEKVKQQRDRIFQKEGLVFPGRTYREVVLEPAYNEAKHHLLSSMMMINKAHLIMLTEQGLVSDDDAKNIARAIMNLDLQSITTSCYSGQVEDLFFQIESDLLKSAGEIAGNLHIGRSRNDMCITMFRMALREKLQTALSSLLYLKEQLLGFASSHTNTLMIGYTHTQQAQPTTLGHYLLAVVDSLNRDFKRLMHAYQNCNQSPMGAAAFTTSGFNINRERMGELLGFSKIVENSYDAIAGADYIAEVMTATQISALSIGRFVQDLLLWSTQEYGVLKVADPYVQISSIMPQKRNPVSLEHLRSLLSTCVGNTQTVLTMIHNTPFGDIVDTEDDMQPYGWKSLELLDKLCRLLACVIGTAEVDAVMLRKRTEASFATITELADTLVRTDGVSFRTAHHIVSKVVKDALAQGIAVNEVTLAHINNAADGIIDKPLQLDEEMLRQALDPDYFIKIRCLPGGPEENEVKRMIREREKQQEQQLKWLHSAKDSVEKAYQNLETILEDRYKSED